jgi:hypothetical protein
MALKLIHDYEKVKWVWDLAKCIVYDYVLPITQTGALMIK